MAVLIWPVEQTERNRGVGSSYIICHIWLIFPSKSRVSLQNSLEQPYTTTIDPPLFRSNCSIPKVYIPPSVAATVRHTADQQSIEFAAILPHRLHFLPGPSHIVPTHHDKLITQSITVSRYSCINPTILIQSTAIPSEQMAEG